MRGKSTLLLLLFAATLMIANAPLLVCAQPGITILSPAATSYYTYPINLNWTVNETYDWAGYSLNSGANISLVAQAELDAEDSLFCSGSFTQACSNAADENWNTYASCSSSSSCDIRENFTIPGLVAWANWSYRVYKIDGITAYSVQYWNYSSSSWDTLDTTPVAEATYWRNVSIPADGLAGHVLQIRNPIENFVTKSQWYYEGKVLWKYGQNTTITPKRGSNRVVVYANDSAGDTGSSEVVFEYVAPASTIQLTLTLDNLANDVFVPGNDPFASASIANTTYSNPNQWYMASYLNNVLNALVFSYQTPGAMQVNRTASSHSLTLSQGIRNARSFLAFTSGDWRTVDNRMELIESGEFLSEPSPSFSHGLGIGYVVKIVLSYTDISIMDDLFLGTGYHDLLFKNAGTSERKIMMNVSLA